MACAITRAGPGTNYDTVGQVTRGTELEIVAKNAAGDWYQACTGADAIVHLAAPGSVPRSVADPTASFLANATGTVMVLEAARRHGNLHTLLASSSSVYSAISTAVVASSFFIVSLLVGGLLVISV